MTPKHSTLVRWLGACTEGSRWIDKTNSDIEAWLTCNRPEWFAWFISRLGYEDIHLAHQLALVANHSALPIEHQKVEETIPLHGIAASIRDAAKAALRVYEDNTLLWVDKGSRLDILVHAVDQVYRNRFISPPEYSMRHFMDALRTWNRQRDGQGCGRVLYSTIMHYTWRHNVLMFLKAMLPVDTIRNRLIFMLKDRIDADRPSPPSQ